MSATCPCRVYAAARNRLGIERAKKLVATWTNTRHDARDYFALYLAVIDGYIQTSVVPT